MPVPSLARSGPLAAVAARRLAGGSSTRSLQQAATRTMMVMTTHPSHRSSSTTTATSFPSLLASVPPPPPCTPRRGMAAVPAASALCGWRRGLSTSSAKASTASKGEAQPEEEDISKNSADEVVWGRSNVSPMALKGKSPQEMLAMLQAKGARAGVRLSELHMLIKACKTPEDRESALEGGLALYLRKNVEFKTETVALLVKAGIATDGVSWVADCLLEPKKRLGIWMGQTASHRLLVKLARAKDAERIEKVWSELVANQVSLAKVTPRALHLVVRGLVQGGQADKAREIFAQHQDLPPAEVTKALMLLQQQEAPPAGEKEEDSGKEEAQEPHDQQQPPPS